MLELKYDEKCYADVNGACSIIAVRDCTECAFYKPVNCEDWVVVTINGVKYLMDPEEYEERRAHGKL